MHRVVSECGDRVSDNELVSSIVSLVTRPLLHVLLHAWEQRYSIILSSKARRAEA